MKARILSLAAVPAAIALLASLALTACGTVSREGDVVWLENDGALMPMWIMGNEDSDVVVLNIHGGPGGTSMTGPYGDDAARFHRTTIQAYWDQRGSGSSRGDPADSTFTLGQFVEDTDLAVETLKALYPDKRIFISGGSWGGELAAAYVVDPERQAKLAGWIMEDGSFNEPLADDLCQGWLMDAARDRIARGIDVDYFRGMLDWLSANPNAVRNFWREGNRDRINEYLDRTNAYDYDGVPESAAASHGVEMTLLSPVNLFGWFMSMDKAGVLLAERSPDIDLTPELANVTIPTLILWGRHDGRVPVQLARIAYDAVSTPQELKRLVIFENSAHSPSEEESDAYYGAVVDFLAPR